MLISLNSSIPRYFVEVHSGSAELGIFSAIFSLLSVGNLVVSAFGQSIFLSVARACAALDRAKYRGYVALAAALGGSLGGVAILAAVLFGRDILTHLFRPEYGERPDILVRLMIAGTILFIASGLGYVITAARSLHPQIPMLLAAAIAAAATSAWSVPRHGLSGAADAALAAAFVQLMGTCAIVLKIDRRLQRSAESSLALQGQASPALRSMKAETT
jgi:O-antigen/teichoic acid export membrane protein